MGMAIAALILRCCRLLRSVMTRVALLAMALNMAKECNADEAFLREFLTCCDELIVSKQKPGPSATLSQTLQVLKATLTTKLPMPVRSGAELQCSALPIEMRRFLHEDSYALDETSVLQCFFAHSAQALGQLNARGSVNIEALFATAPERVQLAFRSGGS